MLKHISFFFLSLFIFSGAAQAQFFFQPGGQGKQKIELQLYDQQFKQKSAIPLKQLIKQQFPGLPFQSQQLAKVVLVAKSKQGGAQAALQVGQADTRVQIIDGNPFDFQKPNKYQRYTFKNPALQSTGAWKIQLQGNVKVRKVVIVFKAKQQKAIVLQYGGQHFKQSSTLFLKQKANQQFGPHILKGQKLKAVVLFAKSKQGNGTATVHIGPQQSWPQVIPGQPAKFQKPGAGNFSKIKFQIPAHAGNGNWQIELHGNIKVQKVKLVFK